MSDFFDTLETRDPGERERSLMAALPQALARAAASAPAIGRQLQGIDLQSVDSRGALARLPVLRKHELLQTQQQSRAGSDPAGAAKAFGGFAAIGWGQALRTFASPGPIYEPESGRADYWRFARALYAAGFRAGQLAYNCFSYHFTPAGSMMETAAHAIGCTVFPGGTGQTEQQVRAIADLAPHGYVGTPSFLKIILEKADELGIALPSLRHALVSGEAFPPSLRDWLASRGVDGYQAYGSADLGMIAFETPAREGLVLGEELILEIVRPGTGDPVPEGEVGEVVVTTFNPDYPLVRFGTGDLSAVMPGMSPCGRTNTRIRGWMGRADQTTKVRGLFVHPSQVADVVARHPEIRRARLVISGTVGADTMTLKAESDAASSELAARVAQTVREVTKLRAEVEWAAPQSLPNDGKVIDDVRSYE
ncbi:phenylacetate--CoA ligase family protein [Bordetella genomosp. 13]|uniref:AMP-dependent synthetase n=1 Tax=Bordetella genomosp. 13 TaxID=463040 RepID=A0A1W6ZHS7_9BORD|nr:AMP-binding protein [Bordetella genomosp. 13]ARP96906.1 AMP-dependent synthetase [Bordetella genomosp. 13]